MNSLNNRKILNLILYFCFFSILFAYYVEIYLGHLPCNLCLIERIPYALSIIIIISLFIFKKFERLALLVLGIIFTLATILSIYHVSIEQGLIQESPICRSNSGLQILDKDELLKELEKNTISCKNPTFFIFGLTLATINTFVSVFFSFITILKFYNYEKK